jgi:hypothetical protein
MPHPLVDQLRFTRSEWLRGLRGVSEEDAARHVGRMNCISWIVGHMAWHEQRYWLDMAQGQVPYPALNQLYAFRAPMSTPVLHEMSAMWNAVTRASEPYLDTVTTDLLLGRWLRDGKHVGPVIGTGMRRITYHYWYHTGEVQAIRQMLGQKGLPQYVGDIDAKAPYRPE